MGRTELGDGGDRGLVQDVGGIVQPPDPDLDDRDVDSLADENLEGLKVLVLSKGVTGAGNSSTQHAAKKRGGGKRRK